MADAKAVTRESIPLQIEIEEISTAGTFRKDARSPGNILQCHLNLFADLLDLTEVGAEHLDAKRRTNARSEHVGAGLDWHGPGIGDARYLQSFVEPARTV